MHARKHTHTHARTHATSTKWGTRKNTLNAFVREREIDGARLIKRTREWSFSEKLDSPAKAPYSLVAPRELSRPKENHLLLRASLAPSPPHLYPTPSSGSFSPSTSPRPDDASSFHHNLSRDCTPFAPAPATPTLSLAIFICIDRSWTKGRKSSMLQSLNLVDWDLLFPQFPITNYVYTCKYVSSCINT